MLVSPIVNVVEFSHLWGVSIYRKLEVERQDTKQRFHHGIVVTSPLNLYVDRSPVNKSKVFKILPESCKFLLFKFIECTIDLKFQLDSLFILCSSSNIKH